MNTPADHDAQRHEWDLQERALREERRGIHADQPSAELARYRFIARALRRPIPDELPEDFATRTTAYAEAAMAAADERFELWLQRGLVVLFALAAVGVINMFGGDWLLAFASALDQFARPEWRAIIEWSLALAGCLTFSAVIGRISRRDHTRAA